MTTQDRPIVYKFDAFTLDLRRGILLSADRREVPLRAKSLTLLQFMLDRAGHLVSREEIMRAVWPQTIGVDDRISQCVRDIRRALGVAARACSEQCLAAAICSRLPWSSKLFSPIRRILLTTRRRDA